MTAKIDRARGKLKEKAGHATGDKKLEGRGHLEQAKGKAKEALHEVKKALTTSRRGPRMPVWVQHPVSW